ncbi:MAG: DUF1634 domain-containing protein [Omnitrophica WOR_2 bacterium]
MAELVPLPSPENQPPAGSAQADMETLVGYTLLFGVVLSALLLIVGIIWNFAQTGYLTLDYGIQGMNLFGFILRDVRRLASGAFSPRLLVNWGIAILLLTPYTRVLASMLYFFFVEHNLKYTLFTAFVFSVLTYSLFLR